MIRLTFVFLMQILTQYFEPSVVSVINVAPDLKTDFGCPHSRLELCHKVNRLLQLRDVDVKFVFLYD